MPPKHMFCEIVVIIVIRTGGRTLHRGCARLAKGLAMPARELASNLLRVYLYHAAAAMPGIAMKPGIFFIRSLHFKIVG